VDGSFKLTNLKALLTHATATAPLVFTCCFNLTIPPPTASFTRFHHPPTPQNPHPQKPQGLPINIADAQLKGDAALIVEFANSIAADPVYDELVVRATVSLLGDMVTTVQVRGAGCVVGCCGRALGVVGGSRPAQTRLRNQPTNQPTNRQPRASASPSASAAARIGRS
jgi:hypothetical protein